jgi:ABC-type bacteriocin/lantibiotic exporter with double-glycine peptidase domain
VKRAALGFATLAAVALAGCYAGGARPFDPADLRRQPGWLSVDVGPVIEQQHEGDCGAAATALLLRYWGRTASPDDIRAASGVAADRGLRADFLESYLRRQELGAALIEGNLGDLRHELTAGRPILVGIAKPLSTRRAIEHYVLVVGLHPARQLVVVADPAAGYHVYSYDELAREWEPTHRLTIVAY